MATHKWIIYTLSKLWSSWKANSEDTEKNWSGLEWLQRVSQLWNSQHILLRRIRLCLEFRRKQGSGNRRKNFPAAVLIFLHSLPSSDVFLSSPFFLLFHQIRLAQPRQPTLSLLTHPTPLGASASPPLGESSGGRCRWETGSRWFPFERQQRGK